MYVFENTLLKKDALFISLNQYTRTPNEKFKKDFCLQAIDDYISNRVNKHNVLLSQDKLKIIESWPFIYWISDGFREKFKGNSLQKYFSIKNGVQTGNNDKYLRFWWEIFQDGYSQVDNYNDWPFYSKGGRFNKWYGNLWLVTNWNELKNNYPNPTEKGFFFEGIVFSGSGSKVTPFRILPLNNYPHQT